MAKVKVRVPYQAFVCPECNSEVEPNKEIFCNNCGVNLNLYKRIEKKTLYRSEEHEDWQICPKSCSRAVPRPARF